MSHMCKQCEIVKYYRNYSFNFGNYFSVKERIKFAIKLICFFRAAKMGCLVSEIVKCRKHSQARENFDLFYGFSTKIYGSLILLAALKLLLKELLLIQMSCRFNTDIFKLTAQE